MYLKRIGFFSFDLEDNGGKIDENIITKLIDNGYKVEKLIGGRYVIFKESPMPEDLSQSDDSTNTNPDENNDNP